MSRLYLAIDGDDIGQKITMNYLSNNELGLIGLVSKLHNIVDSIRILLESKGFSIIFSAADGVVATMDAEEVDHENLYMDIAEISRAGGLTFSVGVGNNLREAYIALMYAKSDGKRKIVKYSNVAS